MSPAGLSEQIGSPELQTEMCGVCRPQLVALLKRQDFPADRDPRCVKWMPTTYREAMVDDAFQPSLRG